MAGEAWLTNPAGNSFYLNFNNFCWTVKLQERATIRKVAQKPSYDPYLWHVRLGHMSETIVQWFLCTHVPEIKLDNKSFFCEQCAKSKALDLKSNGVALDLPCDKPLDLCMTDVAGPFNIDISGWRFLIIMHDHSSMYTFCDIMASRSEVPGKIMKWVLHLKNAAKHPCTSNVTTQPNTLVISRRN
jgi:hypothetical protein